MAKSTLLDKWLFIGRMTKDERVGRIDLATAHVILDRIYSQGVKTLDGDWIVGAKISAGFIAQALDIPKQNARRSLMRLIDFGHFQRAQIGAGTAPSIYQPCGDEWESLLSGITDDASSNPSGITDDAPCGITSDASTGASGITSDAQNQLVPVNTSEPVPVNGNGAAEPPRALGGRTAAAQPTNKKKPRQRSVSRGSNLSADQKRAFDQLIKE